MDYCPRCGSAEIRVFKDGSGWCLRCDMPFVNAASEPSAQQVPAVSGSQPSAIPGTPMPATGQVLSGGLDKASHGTPVQELAVGPWIGTETPYSVEEYSAEERRATTAKVFICVGAAISMAAVALGIFLGLGAFLASSLGSCLCITAFVELGLAAVAFGAGFFIKDNIHRASMIALVAGAVLAVLSLLLLGGILGAIGGGITFIGGLMAEAEH